MDSVPSLSKKEKLLSGPDFSIAAIQDVLPFILEGKLYGWNFIYTPSDKTRIIAEYFEFTPVQKVSIEDPLISYDSPMISDSSSKFSCWVTYTYTDHQKQLQRYRQSVNLPKIKGVGVASIQKETAGIKEAFSNAAKNAIRSYYSTIIKNKPREITGTVYLTGEPRYYINSGKYVTALDLFLEKGTITEYRFF
ncbi:MAG TPA: hypothetical protein VFC68_07050 [Treponemataceae bacterium]|nr:hypothetical protein [Treponemataceae bacterium]